MVHGPTVSKPFTFTVNATNGQLVAVALQMTDNDGQRDLGQAIYNFTVGQTTNSYTNGEVILINDFAAATPYPSTLNVTASGGLINKASVTFSNVNHTAPGDIDALLVSPTGINTFLMAKAGGSLAATRVNLGFDDSVGTYLPQTTRLTTGTYHPTSYASSPPPFPVPAPPAPYNTNLSVFNGANPNGTWLLYVFDDTHQDSGAISNGWTLKLVTTTPVAPSADLAITMTAPQSTVVTTSNLTYNISIIDYGPTNGSSIIVTDALPAGTVYVGSTASQGSVSSSNGVVTWNLGTLGTGSNATLALTLQHNVAGQLTNSMTIVSQNDPNRENNTASVLVNVVNPSADLVLGMIGSANPALVNNPFWYYLSITNLGPATATSIGLTNTLPPGVNLLQATPAASLVSGRVVTFSNLGDLASGARLTVGLQVVATVAGTLTNSATVGSSLVDPLKGNNLASVKTVVEAVLLSFARSGSSLSISWTTDAAGYNLVEATNLTPPTVWNFVTNQPSIQNGVKTVVVPIGPGTKFFRLRGVAP